MTMVSVVSQVDRQMGRQYLQRTVVQPAAACPTGGSRGHLGRHERRAGGELIVGVQAVLVEDDAAPRGGPHGDGGEAWCRTLVPEGDSPGAEVVADQAESAARVLVDCLPAVQGGALVVRRAGTVAQVTAGVRSADLRLDRRDDVSSRCNGWRIRCHS